MAWNKTDDEIEDSLVRIAGYSHDYYPATTIAKYWEALDLTITKLQELM